MTSLAKRIAAVLVFFIALHHIWADGVVADCTEQALRDALAEGGIVTFDSDCSITLTQTIVISAAGTTIDANGHQVTFSGGGNVRILTAAADLTLVGLTFSNGKTTNGGGAALLVNAGANVTANNCVFTSNNVAAPNGVNGTAGSDGGNQGGNGQTGTAGSSGVGGAIWNRGTLTLISCIVSNNAVTGGNGGKGGDGGSADGTLGQGGNGGSGGTGGTASGGGIQNDSNLTLTNCTVASNSSTSGNGGTGGAAGSALFAGRPGSGGAGSAAFGAGIYSSAEINIQSSTLSGNLTRGGNGANGGTQSNGTGDTGPKGGDAYGGALATAWHGSIVNSTFFGNKSLGGNGGNGGDGSGTFSTAGRGGNGGNGVGGGIRNSGTLTLLNCSLASSGAHGGTNGAAGSGIFSSDDGNPGEARGGNIATSGGPCTLKNSLIIWEEFGACGYGTFVDGNYNMTSDTSINLGSQSFPNTTNPRAGVFGDNGGETATLPLLSNSPAIDKIPLNLAPLTDQRGFPRITKADIGAYEGDFSSPPFILVQPTNQTATVSNSATFRVSAVGAPPLSYQWLLAGNRITNATASSYTVTVTAATLTNLGPYQVVITNRFGTNTSQQAFLLVPPAITVQPTNQVVLAGADVNMNVGSTGQSPLYFQWMLNGTNLAGATSSLLQLTNVQVGNIGTYKVAVTNSGGTVMSSAATLNLRPTILSQPVDQTVSPGAQAVFHVSATGTPSLTYQWTFNALPISGATSDTLTNNNVTVTNSGIYLVSIANSYGSTNSAPARLTVLARLSGSVLEGSNGVPEVRVSIGTNQVITASDGSFGLDVPATSSGINYLVTPELTNYAFFPANVTVHVSTNATLDSFSATPLIRAAIQTNNTVHIFGGGISNLSYVILFSTNLVQWQPLATNVAPIGFSDPSPILTNRYYRLIR